MTPITPDAHGPRRRYGFVGTVTNEALWQLYFNGHKPTLRPARFSAERMLEQPSPNVKHGKLQERLVHETKLFLKRHGKDA